MSDIKLGDILRAISSAQTDGLDVEQLIRWARVFPSHPYQNYVLEAKHADKVVEAAEKHGIRVVREPDYIEPDEETGEDVLWAVVKLHWNEPQEESRGLERLAAERAKNQRRIHILMDEIDSLRQQLLEAGE